jgi:rRNA-processing protein FCF1
MKELLHVVPDTNIFLHYPPLSDIDWRGVCDASRVHLVICLQVIHELDEKKSDSRLAGRAERALKEIREANRSGKPIRESVRLSIFNRELRNGEFPPSLSPDSGDDKIVHLARKYREENPGLEVAVATEDLGMELRCEAGGVAVVRMDSVVRLENPQDELLKKYRQAVTELNSLKNRLPDLCLQISASGKAVERDKPFVFQLRNSWKPINVESEMREIAERHPKQACFQSYSDYSDPMRRFVAATSASPAEWKRYDEELDIFLDEYREYLKVQNLVGETRLRSVAMEFWLCNDGKGPATDIDFIVHFPSGISWLGKSGTREAAIFENDIEAPKPPEQPAGLAGLYAKLAGSMPSRMSEVVVARSDDLESSISVTSVVENGEGLYAIHGHLKRVKHGHQASLGVFFAVLSSREDIKPFQVSYTISASELLENAEGALTVRVIAIPEDDGEEDCEEGEMPSA